MLQYLIILLGDASTSYCHYENKSESDRLIPLDTLREGIRYAMLENLMIQFVYPETPLPEEYAAVIESIDHSKIKPLGAPLIDEAEVIVTDTLEGFSPIADKAYVLRSDKAHFFAAKEEIGKALSSVTRLNVVITDLATMTESELTQYRETLDYLADIAEKAYVAGKSPQLNLLTDRMMLDKMNNCDAGWKNIILAPNGKFYICPAFYHEDESDSVGDLENGLDIKNPQLYRLDHAPLCRNCDAYQCKRCVWLNRKTTLEVNTPSHEQCVAAHHERNASRILLNNIRKHGTFLPERDEIKEIDYLDPFDVRKEW
ncbi:MAG: CXXX repeat peptide maturase [Bacteroidaceae bacterium]|nr:CXXX repeat peptide maturase [Bacteroidaceae bacterium]